MAEPDKKLSVADEIDWKIIDQLHDATSRISNDCFEYKKLCIAVVAAVVALMVKFGSTENFANAMILCAICCTEFWISDAPAYFYQRKLRSLLEKRISNISKRHSVGVEEQSVSFGWLNSFSNPSMALSDVRHCSTSVAPRKTTTQRTILRWRVVILTNKYLRLGRFRLTAPISGMTADN